MLSDQRRAIPAQRTPTTTMLSADIIEFCTDMTSLGCRAGNDPERPSEGATVFEQKKKSFAHSDRLLDMLMDESLNCFSKKWKPRCIQNSFDSLKLEWISGGSQGTRQQAHVPIQNLKCFKFFCLYVAT
ncbi:hypothetical protein AVEN_151713-1 [Araneus ventricosus]|uniref:Uncharacterized protein n=1 Tax=Araneus ventricosus TaxID=182803 RepID=A0A4Y2DMX7_ARAVE|nr:hypothetical protein AVEN_151713-1 [Araneus ventricosus]